MATFADPSGIDAIPARFEPECPMSGAAAQRRREGRRRMAGLHMTCLWTRPSVPTAMPWFCGCAAYRSTPHCDAHGANTGRAALRSATARGCRSMRHIGHQHWRICVGETIRVVGDATVFGPRSVELPTHHGPCWRRRDSIALRHPGAVARTHRVALPSVGQVPL
jgi:hypothetical protein